jgi:hypothetical protein
MGLPQRWGSSGRRIGLCFRRGRVCGGELAGDGVVEPCSHQGKAGRGVGASLLGTHPGVPERAADGGGCGVVAGVAVFVVVGPCVDRGGVARRGQGDGGGDVAARGG